MPKKRSYTMENHFCTLWKSRGCNYVPYGKTDLDHVLPRGAGGSDHECNLMPLCRKHHQEKGNIGRHAMAEKYDIYWYWLSVRGWWLDSEDRLQPPREAQRPI